MKKEISLKSYAKVNLSFDILGIMDDGYHDVLTVLENVSLFDTVDIKFQEGLSNEIRLKTNKAFLPNDDRNIAYKAALLMLSHEKAKKGIVEIYIEKHIPVAAGLAGGSGNAAAVIVGLNDIFEMNLSLDEMLSIGRILGSDVPFCIMTIATNIRCALGKDRGDRLEKIDGALSGSLVLAKPRISVSTKDVYSNIDKVEIKKRPDTYKLVDAIINNKEAFNYMENVLEAYTVYKYKEVMELKEKLESLGFQKVLMCGSGPTMFGICKSLDEAKDICNKLRNMNYEAYWASFRD